MKKFVWLIFLIVFIGVGYLIINNKKNIDEYINELDYIEDIYGEITNNYIYGTHFNIEGNIELSSNNISLVLKNGDDEEKLDIITSIDDNIINFKTSDKINSGINLDKLKQGNWYLLLKDNDNNKYYSFINKTSYGNLEYYTMTKDYKNNKIDIFFDEIEDKKINYVGINIKEDKLPSDVYDIIIDPGHGGVDSGASHKVDGVTYNEADLTLEIALKLKKKLENSGYKVLLTRNSDVDLEYYNDNGRAVLPNKYHTKLSLSLHLNSEDSKMNYGGVEVYIPNDVEYYFARLLASNIASTTEIGYSKKTFNKVENGIYFNYFKEADIIDTNNEMIKLGYEPYNILVGAPEMYMIREVGGIMTHAYVDGKHKKKGFNKYYNSNQTTEGYLIELGYLSYQQDAEIIVNNSDLFALAISNSIIDYYK